MLQYLINQFLLDSDLPLPATADDKPVSGREPLHIRYTPGKLTHFAKAHWMGTRANHALRSYDVGDGVLVSTAQHFKMHVSCTGSNISLDFPEGDSVGHQIAAAITTNLGMSICTLFKGALPLHGAGVNINGSLVGIMAPSGTGKSTLLWTLLDQGAEFVNDDVIPLCINEQGIYAVPAGSLHAKLSKTALEHRALNSEDFQEWAPGSDEYWVPIEARQRVQGNQCLKVLFILRPRPHSEMDDSISIRQIEPEAVLPLLVQNTQGLWAVSKLLDGAQLFNNYQRVIRSVPIYAIEYPKCTEVLLELHQMITDICALHERE